jgi:hypothetical protein
MLQITLDLPIQSVLQLFFIISLFLFLSPPCSVHDFGSLYEKKKDKIIGQSNVDDVLQCCVLYDGFCFRLYRTWQLSRLPFTAPDSRNVGLQGIPSWESWRHSLGNNYSWATTIAKRDTKGNQRLAVWLAWNRSCCPPKPFQLILKTWLKTAKRIIGKLSCLV